MTFMLAESFFPVTTYVCLQTFMVMCDYEVSPVFIRVFFNPNPQLFFTGRQRKRKGNKGEGLRRDKDRGGDMGRWLR